MKWHALPLTSEHSGVLLVRKRSIYSMVGDPNVHPCPRLSSRDPLGLGINLPKGE